ncbi:MAG: flagellar hook assembly protein FlgD [Agarilytica sp.]
MPEVNDLASTSVFQDFSIRNQETEEKQDNELGQSAFLELMITQMKNQDPLSPQDNTEFIAQLAQFSSVEALDKMNNNFDTFTNNFVANQALQASTLVGRSVTVPTDRALLEAGEVVSASVDVPVSTGDVKVNIYTENGGLVDQVSLGTQPAGELVMRWDGMNMEVNGDLMDWSSSQQNGAPAGNYRIEVTAEIDGKPTELSTALSANVNSVTVGASGQLVLNLAGVGAISLNEVKQFNE